MTRLMMYNRWWSLWSCSSSLRRGIMLSLLEFEAGLQVVWMLLLSVHRMMSLVDSGSIDESLLDLLRIALDATSSGAIYQTASLTSDEVRKIERSVRLMAARNLAPCIRRNDINEDNIFYTPVTGTVRWAYNIALLNNQQPYKYKTAWYMIICHYRCICTIHKYLYIHINIYIYIYQYIYILLLHLHMSSYNYYVFNQWERGRPCWPAREEDHGSQWARGRSCWPVRDLS